MKDEADLLLMGGGAAISFDVSPPSPWHVGIVLRKEATQQTEFRTKKPLFWDDGRKRMQVVVTLQTEERNTEDASDDGIRLLFVKGKNMTNAVRAAVKAAGCSSLEVGGRLGIRYTQDGPNEGGAQPPKEYQAKYEPPTAVQPDDPTPPAAEGDDTYAPPPDEEPF